MMNQFEISRYFFVNSSINNFFSNIIFFTIYLISIIPQQVNASIPQTSALAEATNIFPVGLNIENRNVNPSIIIRGKEDGTKAINLETWLLPFDAIIDALDFTIKTLPDGQLEIRSPGIIKIIDPKKLPIDTELGLAFSIQDLDTLFGIKAKFNIIEYVIELNVPWLNQNTQKITSTEPSIILNNIPRITPQKFSFTAIEQKLTTNNTNSRGNLLAVGSALGGSWYLRTEQPNFQNTSTWRIAEAQLLWQNNQADYILGSQPTFWRSEATSDYWGLTYIQRNGFTPTQQIVGGFVDARSRLQAAQVGHTINGRAEPGTLVRLIEAFSERIIAEALVDSSGIYRFENVSCRNSLTPCPHRVLLYPQGRLTTQPEIRKATYSNIPGQLPQGTSVLIASTGLRRDFENRNLLGNFANFRGGIAQRWGLSEDITIGLGGVYDDSPLILTELFFRPTHMPLQVAVSALAGNHSDINADIRFTPTPNLSASFTSDKFSHRFNLDWRISPQLSLFASSTPATTGGIQLNFSGRNFFTFARASLDTENRLRWTLLQRLGALELNQRGNEIGTLSELSYNLSGKNNFLNLGHSLLLNYETRNQNRSDNLLTLLWRYRSQERAVDGNYLWEAQFGYGIGSQGTGPIATLSTTLLPGILLRARYQGVALTDSEQSFNIDLVSSLSLQQGITPGDRRSHYFRTQGGMLIQPFLDKNNNHKWDTGEKLYTENIDTLLTINNRLIKSFQPEISSDRVFIRLNPGTYRLDIDPAGFPENWQAVSDAYAVDVVAGSYTPILLPLIPAYGISGTVTDIQGNPISGARVEAISTNRSSRVFSVTNTAGVYYLERLQQGNYKLLVNDKSIHDKIINLNNNSLAFTELNIQQLENLEFKAVNPK